MFITVFYSEASLLKIRSTGDRVIFSSISRFCLNCTRSTFVVSTVDLSEMIEKGETKITLPIEMADTEMHLIDCIIKRSAFFEIIRKRKKNIEKEFACLQKAGLPEDMYEVG